MKKLLMILGISIGSIAAVSAQSTEAKPVVTTETQVLVTAIAKPETAPTDVKVATTAKPVTAKEVKVNATAKPVTAKEVKVNATAKPVTVTEVKVNATAKPVTTPTEVKVAIKDKN